MRKDLVQKTKTQLRPGHPSSSQLDPVSNQLNSRPSRKPHFELENQSLRKLMRKLAYAPEIILQELAEQAIFLCGATSAGISMAEEVDGKQVFCWRAVAGNLSSFLNSTVPKECSPCQLAIDQNEVQLLENPALHYDYIRQLGIPVHELLLVPLHRGDQPIGTIWIVSDSPEKKFDSEDRRLMQSLAEFSSAALMTYQQIADGKTALSELEQERTRAQEAENRFREALDNAQMNAWKINLITGRIAIWGGKTPIYGVDVEDEDPFLVLRRHTHTEDLPRVIRVLEQAIKNRTSRYDEYRIVKPDGTIRWIMTRSKIKTNKDGEAVSMTGVITDITERKEVEARLTFERNQLETLFQQSPAAMVLWTGPEFVFEKVNPVYQAIFPGRILKGRRVTRTQNTADIT